MAVTLPARRLRKAVRNRIFMDALESRIFMDTTAYTSYAGGAAHVYNGHDLYLLVKFNATSDDGTYDSMLGQFTSNNPNVTVTAGNYQDTNITTTVHSLWGTSQNFPVGSTANWLWEPETGGNYWVVKVHTNGAAALNGQTVRISWKTETYASSAAGSDHIYRDASNGQFYDFQVLATPASPTATFTTKTAIPGLAQWEEDMLNWGRFFGDPTGNDNYIDEVYPTPTGPRYNDGSGTWTLTGGTTSETVKYSEWYYDGERVNYQFQDYTGHDGWTGAAETIENIYRDHYVLTFPAGSAPSIGGSRTFSKGLELDYLRTGDTLSRDAVIKLANDWTFSSAGGRVQYSDIRETSYALNAQISYRTIMGTDHPKMQQSLDMLLGIVDQLAVSDNATVLSPDYDAINMIYMSVAGEALINYYNTVSADPAIADAVKKLADWVWPRMYIPETGALAYERLNQHQAYQGDVQAEAMTLGTNAVIGTSPAGWQGVRIAPGQTTASVTYTVTGSGNGYELFLDCYDTAGANATIQFYVNNVLINSVTLNGSGGVVSRQIPNAQGNFDHSLQPGDVLKFTLTGTGADPAWIDKLEVHPTSWNTYLFTPVLGFLYNTYGETPENYAARGDSVFFATSEYNRNNGYWNGKNFSQDYRWSHNYVQWRQNHAWTGDSTAPTVSSVNYAIGSRTTTGYDDWNKTTNTYDPAHRKPTVVINWTSNEASQTEIQYGPAVGQYTNTFRPIGANLLKTNHSVAMADVPAGTYHYRIKSIDSNGNIGYSRDYVFTAPSPTGTDTTAPKLLSPTVKIYESYNQRIDWDNNEDAASVLEYGKADGSWTWTTPMPLAGRSGWKSTYQNVPSSQWLVSGQTYRFRITSTDPAGNQTVSPWMNFIFGTDTTAPTLSVSSPANGANLSGIATINATVSDNVGVTYTEYRLDGELLGQSIGNGTHAFTFDTANYTTGAHTLTVTTRDANANGAAPNVTSTSINVNITTGSGQVPAAPSGLSATAGPASIALTWSDNSTNETGFNVWRSTSPTTGFTIINTNDFNDFDYTDSSAAAGTTYYYRITAFNGNGESANSNTANATITSSGIPTPPSNLIATPGASSILLEWTDNSNNEDYFHVWRSPDNQNWAIVKNTVDNVTSWTDTDVTPGTLYYYRVNADNVNGWSGYSNTASATPGSSVPAAPSNVAAAPNGAAIDVTWNDNSGNETGFHVWRSTAPTSGFTTIQTTGIGATGISDNTATPGTLYYYRVTAFNASGDSANSNTASATIPAGSLPAAPSGLSATTNATTVTLNWSDNSNNEEGFRVWRSEAPTSGFVIIFNSNQGVTTYPDNSATPGTLYYYRITAYNNTGDSSPSNTVSATILTVPAAPSNLTATPNGANIDLVWNDNSNNETTFRVWRSTDNVSFAIVKNNAENVNTWSDNTVNPGTLYYYRITANNSSGDSAASNTVSATVSSTPAAPTNLLASSLSNAVSLTWSDVSTNEDGFRVWRSTSPTSGFAIIFNSNAGVTSYIDNSIAPGTLYYYRITSTNSFGDSAPSNTVNATIAAAPAMPAALKALWRFDEGSGTAVNDTDTDGIADTATITGAATRTAGKVGNALTLSGSTQYVQVPNSTDVNISGTGFSIALFAKSGAANWNTTNTFASKGNGYRFGGVSGTKNIQFGLYIGNAWRTLTYTNPGDISANFHHYAGTYDGTTMRIWVDGVNVASMARTGSIAANTSVLYLGRISNTYLNGSLDEVRLYNTALNATSIANLSNQAPLSVTGLTVNSPNSAAYSIQNYALATGISQYGNVTKNFTTIPSKYLGRTFLRTSGADATAYASNLITLTVNQPVILSVAFDDAIAVKPTWLTSQFTDTGDNIVSAQGTFSVYNVLLQPGTIVLGGAGGLASQGMYSVFFTSIL